MAEPNVTPKEITAIEVGLDQIEGDASKISTDRVKTALVSMQQRMRDIEARLPKGSALEMKLADMASRMDELQAAISKLADPKNVSDPVGGGSIFDFFVSEDVETPKPIEGSTE